MIARQWTRLAHAVPSVLFIRVNLELDGVPPPHVWSLDTASKLLAPSCWVEKIEEATSRKTDMSTFRLTAWTRDTTSIPTSRPLEVAEPEIVTTYDDPGLQLTFGNLPPFLRQKKTLTYEVLFHIRSVADFTPRSPSPSPSPPSSDGDSGHDGNPDRTYGERGQGPRLQGFRVRRGVEDDAQSGVLPRHGDDVYDTVTTRASSPAASLRSTTTPSPLARHGDTVQTAVPRGDFTAGSAPGVAPISAPPPPTIHPCPPARTPGLRRLAPP